MLLYDALCDSKSKAITTFAAVSQFVDTIKSLKDLLFLTFRDFFSAIGDRKEDLFIFLTTGTGSPAIYSTADITASSAKLIAKSSEGIVIEGKNSVTINDCELTDDNTTLNGQSTTYKNIFLYQSMSGDAADGQAEFTATNSDITTNKGDTLYVTNTTASINWGSSGSNGGNVTLTMTKQKASGNIVIDSISTLDMTMKSGSSYTGTINGDNSAKSIKLTLDKKSKIKLTGDSYVTSLDDADTDYSNIDFNGYTLYVNGTAINK